MESKNQSMQEDYHIPVLLNETIEGLHIQPNGVYVDCTFGGGGHSKMILQQLGMDGRLFVFDQDADAQRNVPDDKRIVFVPQNFKHLQRFLRLHGVQQVDGIMADLGVSSHQFDEAERGFSIRFDAPLDMRMDVRTEQTAADVLNTFSETQLHKMFEQYGEVTNSKTLANAIFSLRKVQRFSNINHFKQSLSNVVKGNPNKYFAQVFQALRIQVNDELGALKEMLQQAALLLKPGGRLAIITFHSLEDRIVKNFIRSGHFEVNDDDFTNPFAANVNQSLLKSVNKKPIEASKDEMKRNGRSRSAKLRVAERNEQVK
jgi:16S rRNA (cytosine1402-N4)-methyltransferase